MNLSKLRLGLVGVACAMVVGMGTSLAWRAPAANAGGLEEIVLDAGFHHIGDLFIASWIVPEPEGTTLEIMFRLTQGQIRRAKTAHFEFFLLQNDWSNIIVNGQRWFLPVTANTDGRFVDITGKTLFSIPTSFLEAGLNSIVFESTQRGNNYDDLEIGEVVLMLNR